MSEIKRLLPAVPKYFKANLHTHSTVTDGKFSPEELRDLYKKQGYQILSITDHNVVVDHSALNQEDFLLLTGAEFGVSEPNQDALYKKSYHLTCISKRPDNNWQPLLPRKPRDATLPYLEKVDCPDIPRSHCVESINEIIEKCNEHDYLVVYNHPVWSLHNYTDYAGLKGLWGMEICNYNCLYSGRDTYSTTIYRDMLEQGNRLFPLGCDDMHTLKSFAGAWIMVGAEALNYSNVIDALKKGDFYASTGPEIYSLTLEGSMLKITCSDAASIALESDCRFAKRTLPAQSDDLLHEATFDLTKWIEGTKSHETAENAYIRLTVYGPYGHRAFTRAYFYNELF